MLNGQVFLRFLVRVMIAALPACVGQAEPPASRATPGQPAPDIKLQKLLNAPEGTGTSWGALQGKVVVVEFWGTYCAPCVKNIPLMNKLESVFANEPVVFIHITDEDETTVRKFLEATPIHGWIGIDNDRTTMKGYGVTGLPRSAVVGKDGRFLGWTSPFRLVNEPEILKQIFETGSSPELRETQASPVDPLRGIPRAEQETDPRHSLCDIVIRRATPNRSKLASGADSRGVFYFNETLLKHISLFWDVPPPRIITEMTLPEETYDIVALGNRAKTPEFRDVVRRLIEVTFELSVTGEKRVMEAYVLRPLPEREPEFAPSLSGLYTDEATGLYAPNKTVLERMKAGEHFFFAINSLNLLADTISAEVNKPVVAELGDLPSKYDGYYTICFPYDKGSDTTFIDGLEEHVGLTLASDKRQLDVLVVRKGDHEQSTPGRP